MPDTINRTLLSNGTSFVSKKLSHFSGVALAVSLKGGSREESSDEIGLTHLLEHLVFKRTSRLSPGDIAREIDIFGGDINAYTDTEEICLYGEVPLHNLEDLLKLFAELLCDCQFNDNDFQVEKDVIKQEIADAKDDPESVVFQRFSELFWPESSFGLPVFGYADTVAGIGRERVEERLSELLVGNRLMISVAGNIDHNQVASQVEKYFSSLPAGSKVNSSPVQTRGAFEKLATETEQAYLTLGIPCPSLKDDQIYSAELVSSSLGELMSSRLFQELREKRGLAYEISSSVESYPDTGALLIQGSFEKSRVVDALGVIQSELKNLKKSFLTKAELELAKAHTLARLSLEQDSLSSYLWRLQEGESLHGRYVSVEEDKNSVSRINLDDISCYIETWFKQSSMVAVLGSSINSLELEDYLNYE